MSLLEVPCPRCAAAELVPDGPWAACPSCGHRAATPYVTELAWLRDQRRVLAERLAWVEARVAAGDAPLPAQAPRVAAPVRAPFSGQLLLLATGGLLLVTAATVFLAVNWRGLGAAAQVASVVAAIAVAAGAAQLLRASSPATASTLAAVATGILGVGLAAAPRLLADGASIDRAAWYAVVGAVTAAAAAGAGRLTGDRGYLRAGLVALAIGSLSGAVWLGANLSVTALLVTTTLITVTALVSLLRLPGTARWAVGCAAVGPVLVAAVLLPVRYVDHADPLIVALLLGVAAALLVAADRLVLRGRIGSLAPVALVSAALGALPGPRTLVVAAVLLAAGALAAVVTVRAPGRLPERRALAVAAAVPLAGGALLVFLALAGDPADTAVVLTAATAALLGAALVPALRLAAPLAAVVGWCAAAALVDAQAWVLDPEGVGLVAGVPPLLAAAVWTVSARSFEPSLLVWGPGLSLLVLPSALASGVLEPVAPRTAGVLAAAVLLVVTGLRARLAAPVVVGAAAAAVVAVEQVLTLAELLPRWVSLLLAGAALLAAGLRVERLRALGSTGRVALTALR